MADRFHDLSLSVGKYYNVVVKIFFKRMYLLYGGDDEWSYTMLITLLVDLTWNLGNNGF